MSNVLEIIEQMPKTFPSPQLIFKNLIIDGEFLLLGINNKKAYIAQFELQKENNNRYYPYYKNIQKNFNEKEGLLDYEHYLKEIYDPLKYEIIYDLIYFNQLYT